MSMDLEHQLAAYGSYLEELTPAVATETDPAGPTVATRPYWRGPAIAAAAAAVVLVVFGSLILLAPFSQQDAVPVTDPPVVTIPPVVTVPALVTTTTPFVGPVISFEWEMHELSEFVTYPARWRDGYVALMGDQVVSSVDGTRWAAWPEQPAELADRDEAQLALVVDDGDVVVVVAKASAPLRAFASDGEEPWRELPVEQPGTLTDSRRLELILNADDGLYVQTRETYLRQGESFVVTSLPDDLAYDGGWTDAVRRSWRGITLPDETYTVGERDGRFTAFTWPESGETWTSTDGNTWQSIDPVAVPVTATSCHPPEPAVSPEVVETGPLGWFAAGSWCAPTIVWYSPDGMQWQTIDNIERLSGFDIFIPVPPTLVVEDQRVLIYGNLADAEPGPNPAVWIGTPQTRD